MKKLMLAAAAFATLGASPSFAKSEYSRLYEELVAADIAADKAWDSVKTPAEYAARKQELRKKMIAGIGGLFERCPLNAQVVATVPRDGYSVEKVMFETLPGIHVTALVFVPDAKKFKAPYPAVAVTCGHAFDGKADAGYQRACAVGAKEGFLMIIYDPFGQGERAIDRFGNCCWAHNHFESIALRAGRSAAAFRIWDGMRVLDYLESRPDVNKDKLGLMGNSGGGTMTSLIMALDPRLKAAAPSCYISTMREVVRSIGPQDAEQCMYGQLRDGINHASLVLMADAAVRLQFAKFDFFPNKGSMETYCVVTNTAHRLGMDDRYSCTTNPGEHGWREASRRSSLDWMRQWLMDEKPNGRDDAYYSALDKDFDLKTADAGLPRNEAAVVTTPGGLAALKGERNFYDVIIDELIGAKTPRLVFCDTEGGQHAYYGSSAASEENAVIARMLGRSLIVERREQIVAAARAFAAKEGKKPVLVAYDSWERPAEQVYKAHPELFAGFKPLGDGTVKYAERGEARR